MVSRASQGKPEAPGLDGEEIRRRTVHTEAGRRSGETAGLMARRPERPARGQPLLTGSQPPVPFLDYNLRIPIPETACFARRIPLDSVHVPLGGCREGRPESDSGCVRLCGLLKGYPIGLARGAKLSCVFPQPGTAGGAADGRVWRWERWRLRSLWPRAGCRRGRRTQRLVGCRLLVNPVPVEFWGLPPLRQKEVARMGHGALQGSRRGWSKHTGFLLSGDGRRPGGRHGLAPGVLDGVQKGAGAEMRLRHRAGRQTRP